MKGIVKPFNAERHIKYLLCSNFLGDAHEHFERGIFIMNQGLHNTSSVSKNILDFLFSIECSLKSMIFSLSLNTETPEDAYKIVRQCSHNIKRLYNEVESRAKRRFKLLKNKDNRVLIDAMAIPVNFRYNTDLYINLRNDDSIARMFNEGKVSSLINYEFLKKLSQLSNVIKKLADDSNHKYLLKYAPIKANNHKKAMVRLESFRASSNITFI